MAWLRGCVAPRRPETSALIGQRPRRFVSINHVQDQHADASDLAVNIPHPMSTAYLHLYDPSHAVLHAILLIMLRSLCNWIIHISRLDLYRTNRAYAQEFKRGLR